LPQGALAKAAAFYGCTLRSPTAPQQQPLDVPSFACNYPSATGAEYAASAFGQAAVEVSPLGMTMICAAAETGVWRPPSLLMPGTPGSPSTSDVRRLPAAVSAQLRVAMRAVVTSGTATAISGTPVAGKTGTAEYGTGNPLPTHAWFTGYLGHYAVTVLVQDGGFGGSVAAPLAARFLTEAASSASSGGVPA
jgi:cell division protein FtsI/penicillin-binding protein 2